MRNLTLGNLAPSFDDLALLPVRASQQLKSFAYYYGLDDIFGRIRGSGAAVIAENTGGNASSIAATITKDPLAQQTLAMAQSLASHASEAIAMSGAEFAQGADLGQEIFSQGDAAVGWVAGAVQAWKNLGGLLPYLFSKFCLMTILMSVIINRCHFYASTRTPLVLWWPLRLGLYLLPIVAIGVQAMSILEALRCQTSPDYFLLRYDNASKIIEADYGAEGGFVHGLASTLTFWESDSQACFNANMLFRDKAMTGGSLRFLWPLFLTICLGAGVDTLAGSLQGRPHLSDASLLELSFAFNEAETMVVKLFETAFKVASKREPALGIMLSRDIWIQTLNTSPDMLLVALIWAGSALTSLTLNIFNKRQKYRLVSTTFWGIAYLATIERSLWKMWCDFTFPGTFWTGRIPMILMMGFIPHGLICIGIVICATIYGAALLMTALSMETGPDETRSFSRKLRLAYDNLQANVHFANSTPLQFKMTDDFFTTLLNVGFTIVFSASEAVFLTEGARVRIADMTWVERRRFQELEQGLLLQKTRQAFPMSGLRTSGTAPASGYNIERQIRRSEREDALAMVKGLDESSSRGQSADGRWVLAGRLITSTFWLTVGFTVRILVTFMSALGIRWRPTFLVRLMALPKRGSQNARPVPYQQQRRLEAIRFPDGELKYVGHNPSIDIEEEFRAHSGACEDLDNRLYEHWRDGGFWGDVDTSIDYVPSQQDDDTTSMISMSSNLYPTENDWEDTSDDDGRRTPTQRNPHAYSREQTPMDLDGAFSSEHLASLLDPKTPNQQHEARLLARRLRRDGILTRSQYNREVFRERAELVITSRPSATGFSSQNLTAEDEEAALEAFILQRRKVKQSAASDGGSGQCIVCYTEPRTILLWPCGCLSLCDDCRVNMAARNYNKCVSCRTKTIAYSKLYVP